MEFWENSNINPEHVFSTSRYDVNLSGAVGFMNGWFAFFDAKKRRMFDVCLVDSLC
jgi:hypothetical protein